MLRARRSTTASARRLGFSERCCWARWHWRASAGGRNRAPEPPSATRGPSATAAVSAPRNARRSGTAPAARRATQLRALPAETYWIGSDRLRPAARRQRRRSDGACRSQWPIPNQSMRTPASPTGRHQRPRTTGAVRRRAPSSGESTREPVQRNRRCGTRRLRTPLTRNDDASGGTTMLRRRPDHEPGKGWGRCRNQRLGVSSWRSPRRHARMIPPTSVQPGDLRERRDPLLRSHPRDPRNTRPCAPPAEPARLRNYGSTVEVSAGDWIPVHLQSADVAAGHHKQTERPFQLMSIGGWLLTRIRNQGLAQGNISLAVELGFFEIRSLVGVGVDLYRGIPVLSSDGVVGGATAVHRPAGRGIREEGEADGRKRVRRLLVRLTKLVAAISGT